MSIHAQNMIAGSLPRTDQSPETAVYLVAREALDTNRVHTIIVEHETHIYYLAVPSADLASAMDTRTQLAAALPSHPQHQGDASYVLFTGVDAVAIIKRGTSMRLITNAAEAVSDALDEEGLPVVDVANLVPWPFNSPSSRDRSKGEQLSAKLTRVAVIWGLSAGLVAGLLSAANGFTPHDASQVDYMSQIVRKVQFTQPYAADMSSVQKLSGVVVRAGGWIENYSLEKGVVSFDLRLPAWVTPDVIASLGPGIKSEFDPKSNMIIVTKGAKAK